MVNIKRILVPVDFSKYSVKGMDYALSIAKSNKAEVIALHIIKPLDKQSSGLDDHALEYFNKLMTVETMTEKLNSWLLENFENKDLAVKKVIKKGEPISETIETAKVEEADLIVVCTKGLTGFSKVLMSSFAENLVRNTDLPVLIIK